MRCRNVYAKITQGRHFYHSAYYAYGYEGEPAHENYYSDDIGYHHHVYINRNYYPYDFYYDPYDDWYFEPNVYVSFGFYYGHGWVWIFLNRA